MYKSLFKYELEIIENVYLAKHRRGGELETGCLPLQSWSVVWVALSRDGLRVPALPAGRHSLSSALWLVGCARASG